MAESLFQEGRKLLRDKKYDEACPKFVESARLDPSSGVELALGLCYEGQGKTASAWGAYVLAASLARRDNRADREKAANDRATELSPKLSRVTIDVAADTARRSGVVVREDGIVLGSEAWKDAPLDPGQHKLVVTAPGKKTFERTFGVELYADRTTIEVPVLEDDAGDPTSETKLGQARHDGSGHPPSGHESSALKPLGYVVGALGLASVGVGSAVGFAAINKASSVNKVCPQPTCTNASAVSANATAGTLADWSTATLIAGGAGVVVGALLVLLGPDGGPDSSGKSAQTTASRLRPLVGPGALGLGYEW